MEQSKYKIYGATNGKAATLIEEFNANTPAAAKEKLEELQKDLQYLNTYLFLVPNNESGIIKM
jgi:hypothetical protein